MYILCVISYFWELFLAAHKVVIVVDQLQIRMNFVWPHFV